MDERLKGIQAKFDVVQREEISKGEGLAVYLLGLVKCVKSDVSFESWWKKEWFTIPGYNHILKKQNISPITEEDMRYLYECLQRKFS